MKINEILSETPQDIGYNEFEHILDAEIQEKKNNGCPVITVNGNLKKIEGSQQLYYWYEGADGNMILGCSFDVTRNGIKVSMIRKNSNEGNHYATELYADVLANRKTITGNVGDVWLMSDRQLSTDGFKIWKRLLDMGYHISVFNDQIKPKKLTPVTSLEEMEKFFGKNLSFQRWQYVITA